MLDTERAVGERVLIFQAGSGFYGIALEWVIAVQDRSEKECARNGSGRLVFREETLPVLDLNELFKGDAEAGKQPSLLIIGRERASLAALVESPGRVVTADETYEWPELCRSMVEGVFSGVMSDRDRLVLLIDPEGLLRATHQNAESSQGGEGL